MSKKFVRYAVASIPAPVLLFVALFGNSADDYAAAIYDNVRATVMSFVPFSLRMSAFDRQTKSAQREAHQVASKITEIDQGVGGQNKEIATLEAAEKEDAATLAMIATELDHLPEGGTTLIGGRKFSRAEIEHDAELILTRVKDRTSDLQSRRSMISVHHQQRAQLVKLLSEWQNRIRQLKVGRLECDRLISEIAFAKRLPPAGIDGAGELVAAEQTLEKTLGELRRQSTTTFVSIDKLVETPVADALRSNGSASASLRDRIAQVTK